MVAYGSIFMLNAVGRSAEADRELGVPEYLHTSGHFCGDPFRGDPLRIYRRYGTRTRHPLAPDVPAGRRPLRPAGSPQPGGREDRSARGDGGAARLLPAPPARTQRPTRRLARRGPTYPRGGFGYGPAQNGGALLRRHGRPPERRRAHHRA